MGSNDYATAKLEAEGTLRAPPDWLGPGDFHRLAAHLPHMVWLCRPDGTLAYLNSFGLRYFGAGLTDSADLFPPVAVLHPEDRDNARTAWQESLRDGKELSLEARLRRSDGAYRWHLLQAQPVRDDANRIGKWMGTSINVHRAREGTELSAFLLELSTDFARMDNPHELVSTAMMRLRRQLDVAQVTLTEFDRAGGRAVMLRQGRLEDPNLQVASLPLAPFEDLSREARAGRLTLIHEVSGEHPQANLIDRWYGFTGVRALLSAPIHQGGELVASLTVLADSPRRWSGPEVELTRRVAEIVWPALEKARSDHELAVSEQRLRLAQAVAQIGAWELNYDVPSVQFSAESFDLFGLNDSPNTDLYQVWVSLIDPRDRHALADLVRECKREGAAEAEYRYRHPTRGLRWIHSRAGLVDEGVPKLIVGMSLDVTERRKAEEELKDVNQRKDEFLAMLAHELRNPLAPIRNAAQILRAHSTGQPELEWARTIIERQTRHLVRLVDDLLDVSRMVRGKIALRKSRIDVVEVIQHAIDTSQPLIRARGHRLHVNLPRGPVMIEGDLIRLAQAVANLLNNAAKYTDEGGEIWLDVSGGEQVCIRVRDTGPGISPALLPHVFELFTQAERTLDRAEGGLGIGLTLVKLLIEMHDGTVEARNVESGQGAEFLVRLPAETGGRGSAAKRGTAVPHTCDVPAVSAPESPQQAMKVLVVDDNVDAADSIALLLTLDGFETRSVHGALAALDTVSTFKPDIILLDIGLPVMDGYEIAQKLRSSIPVEEMRIVALSGYGQQADRERAARAGFDEYLVKPVEPSTLSEFLRSLRLR